MTKKTNEGRELGDKIRENFEGNEIAKKNNDTIKEDYYNQKSGSHIRTEYIVKGKVVKINIDKTPKKIKS